MMIKNMFFSGAKHRGENFHLLAQSGEPPPLPLHKTKAHLIPGRKGIEPAPLNPYASGFPFPFNPSNAIPVELPPRPGLVEEQCVAVA